MGAELMICGESIAPGTQREIEVKVSELYSADPLHFRLTVVRGALPGPTLFIMAALHGDELNGVEIVRRLIYEVSYASLRGTVLLVPVANTFGFLHRSRYMPDRRDLNRSFPGSAHGSAAARMAHFLMHQIITKSDYGIDLHTAAAGRRNLPQVRGDLSHDRVRTLAHAFGCRYILDSRPPHHSVREAALAVNVPVIIYEAGEILTFEEEYNQIGFAGCLQVMHMLGMMLPAAPPPRDPPTVLHQSRWLRAERGGVLAFRVGLGDPVRQGDPIGVTTNPLGRERHTLLAHRDGTVIGLTTLPLVNPGDAICHLAW